MKTKQAFDLAMQSVREAFFRHGFDKKPTEIITKNIPEEWTPFGLVEGDSVKRVRVQNTDIYSVLYFIPHNSEIKPHFHKNIESALLLKGKITIKTPCFIKVINETESFKFEANEWHSIKSIEDSYLFIQFHPPFESSWEAKF